MIMMDMTVIIITMLLFYFNESHILHCPSFLLCLLFCFFMNCCNNEIKLCNCTYIIMIVDVHCSWTFRWHVRRGFTCIVCCHTTDSKSSVDLVSLSNAVGSLSCYQSVPGCSYTWENKSDLLAKLYMLRPVDLLLGVGAGDSTFPLFEIQPLHYFCLMILQTFA